MPSCRSYHMQRLPSACSAQRVAAKDVRDAAPHVGLSKSVPCCAAAVGLPCRVALPLPSGPVICVVKSDVVWSAVHCS